MLKSNTIISLLITHSIIHLDVE